MTTSNGGDEIIIGGRYRVLRTLGRGGMGSVFEAENLRTRRRVAVKTMRPEVAQRAEFARRFEREAQAAAQIGHPHIIDVLDLGDDAATGSLFIVYEMLRGYDLGAFLKVVGRMEPRSVIATALPVIDALRAAHGCGIVHRDLKPDNIFLHETPKGVIPKVIDFGIAKVVDDDAHRTRTGALMGTPSYLSPEQGRGDSSLDARSDVWSLGVVLYRMLSGVLPYEAQNANAYVAKVLYEDPRSLLDVAPDVPADLASVVMYALRRERDERWQSMADLGEALETCAVWAGVDPTTASALIPVASRAVHAPTGEPQPPAMGEARPREVRASAPPAATGMPPAPSPTTPGAQPPSTDVPWSGASTPTPSSRRGLLVGIVSVALAFATAGAWIATRPAVSGSTAPPGPSPKSARPSPAPSPVPPLLPLAQIAPKPGPAAQAPVAPSPEATAVAASTRRQAPGRHGRAPGRLPRAPQQPARDAMPVVQRGSNNSVIVE